MTYATAPDLAARFGAAELLQLTDRDGDGEPDAGVLDLALADATGEIDGYLAARYALPLPEPIPPALVRVAADIARYRLYDAAPTEAVQQRYAEAVAWLRDVARGVVTLGVPATDTPAAAGAGEAEVLNAGETVFGRGCW